MPPQKTASHAAKHTFSRKSSKKVANAMKAAKNFLTGQPGYIKIPHSFNLTSVYYESKRDGGKGSRKSLENALSKTFSEEVRRKLNTPCGGLKIEENPKKEPSINVLWKGPKDSFYRISMLAILTELVKTAYYDPEKKGEPFGFKTGDDTISSVKLEGENDGSDTHSQSPHEDDSNLLYEQCYVNTPTPNPSHEAPTKLDLQRTESIGDTAPSTTPDSPSLGDQGVYANFTRSARHHGPSEIEAKTDPTDREPTTHHAFENAETESIQGERTYENLLLKSPQTVPRKNLTHRSTSSLSERNQNAPQDPMINLRRKSPERKSEEHADRDSCANDSPDPRGRTHLREQKASFPPPTPIETEPADEPDGMSFSGSHPKSSPPKNSKQASPTSKDNESASEQNPFEDISKDESGEILQTDTISRPSLPQKDSNSAAEDETENAFDTRPSKPTNVDRTALSDSNVTHKSLQNSLPANKKTRAPLPPHIKIIWDRAKTGFNGIIRQDPYMSFMRFLGSSIGHFFKKIMDFLKSGMLYVFHSYKKTPVKVGSHLHNAVNDYREKTRKSTKTTIQDLNRFIQEHGGKAITIRQFDTLKYDSKQRVWLIESSLEVWDRSKAKEEGSPPILEQIRFDSTRGCFGLT